MPHRRLALLILFAALAAAVFPSAALASTGVTGRVVDVAGSPVAGLCVNGHLATDGSGPVPPVQGTSTDASGAYTLSVFAAGRVTVTFGGCGEGYGAQGSSVRVDDGATTELDRTMLPPATISGHVVDDLGRPLAGVDVQVMSTDSMVVHAATDGSGNYRVGALAEGSYQLEFVGDAAHAPVFYGGAGVATGAIDEDADSDVASVDLGESEAVTGIDATVPRLGGVSATVRTRAGKSFGAACYVIGVPSPGGRVSGVAEGVTTSAGALKVGSVRPGTYNLYNALRMFPGQPCVATPGPAIRGPFTVKPGAVTELGTLVAGGSSETSNTALRAFTVTPRKARSGARIVAMVTSTRTTKMSFSVGRGAHGRLTVIGHLKFKGSGTIKVPLTGLLAARRLRPGAYRIVARDADGTTRAAPLRITAAKKTKKRH
jgi:hypothetical protein